MNGMRQLHDSSASCDITAGSNATTPAPHHVADQRAELEEARHEAALLVRREFGDEGRRAAVFAARRKALRRRAGSSRIGTATPMVS